MSIPCAQPVGEGASFSELPSPPRAGFPAPTSQIPPTDPSHSRPRWQPLLSLPPSPPPLHPPHTDGALLSSPLPGPQSLISHWVLRNQEPRGWTNQVAKPRHRLTPASTPSAWSADKKPSDSQPPGPHPLPRTQASNQYPINGAPIPQEHRTEVRPLPGRCRPPGWQVAGQSRKYPESKTQHSKRGGLGVAFIQGEARWGQRETGSRKHKDGL